MTTESATERACSLAVLVALRFAAGSLRDVIGRAQRAGYALDVVGALAACHRLGASGHIVARGMVYHRVDNLIMDALREQPMGALGLVTFLDVSDGAVRDRLADLAADGRIERVDGFWRLRAPVSTLPPPALKGAA